MNLELIGALSELEKEKGISKDILIEAIQAAIVSAYKRSHEGVENVRADVSSESGSIRVYAQKEVVEEVFDEDNEISLQAAKLKDPNQEIGGMVEIDVTPDNFGRIAAQTAKQVVIQRIREAERALIYEEFSERQGDVMTGIVQRSEYRNVLVDLGKVEAILPPSEQMPKENYEHGARIKVLIGEVRKSSKGSQVIVSRAHPGLLKRLFELEVPEIHDGIIEIMSVAREAGNRSKIAVKTNDFNVDPVGACVGPRGMRVQSIVEELKGEKIDIVEYSSDPEKFIANALSPARVVNVYANEEEQSARAVVPDHQLSLAIGREGQNARLAARLTGWKIDIKSEAQMAELALLEAEKAAEQRQREAEEKAALESQMQAAVDTAEEIVDEIDPVEDAVAQAAPDETDASVDLDGPVLDEDETFEDAPVAPAAQLDQPGFDIDIPEDLFESPEAKDEVAAPAPARPRKGRAERKELQTMLEEEMLEEEPLPSMLEEADSDTDADIDDASAARLTTGPDAYAEESALEAFHRRWGRHVEPSQRDAKQKGADDKKAQPAKKKKDDDRKTVIKDLSQLAELLDLKDDHD